MAFTIPRLLIFTIFVSPTDQTPPVTLVENSVFEPIQNGVVLLTTGTGIIAVTTTVNVATEVELPRVIV